MRQTLALALAISVSAAATAWAQTNKSLETASAPAATPQPAPKKTPISLPKCNNPNALGIERVVQINTTGGPGFGFEQFKAYDFLRDHEVVLTFDDGPWPWNTEHVLKALADQCTRALFFPIGMHAGWHPEILKEVAAAGMTLR
jgi:peptidoglycan/xylan/chitin deacetylase (PgdA/CDA1 family)